MAFFLVAWLFGTATAFLLVGSTCTYGQSKLARQPTRMMLLTTTTTTSTSHVQLQLQTSPSKPHFVTGPDPKTRPDYDNIHGPMGKAVDDIFLSMFREKLADQVGVDSDKSKVC